MTAIQTQAVTDTLRAWLTGSTLADDLIPRTEALLTQLAQKPTAKRQQIDTAEPDTATMTDAQVFASYKRTALVDDLRFFIAHGGSGMSQLTWDRAHALLAELTTRKATPADRLRYRILTDQWRRSAPDAQTAQCTLDRYLDIACDDQAVSA